MENIKQKSFEEKVSILKDYINGVNVDTVLTLNMYSLIVPNKSFSDDYFDNENIIFSDIMEFLDIKVALKDELDAFISKVLGIYLACYKHCSILNEEETTKIGEQYLKLLCMLDITTIGKLMKKYKPCDDDSYYSESFAIVKQYSEQFLVYSSLVENNIEQNTENVNGN